MANLKLLVDVGNSRVKWAFEARAGFIAQGAGASTTDTWLHEMLDTGHEPQEIRIANVAGGDVETRLSALLEAHFRVVPVFARSAEHGAGVRNGYSDPSRLGVDRWLALCAAFARHRSALCVVDAGTATTIDVLTEGGEHAGGLILAGVELMQSALLHGTGDLARLSAAGDPGRNGGAVPADSADSGDDVIVLGRDTADAIRHGALQATTCLIEACMSRSGRPAPRTGAPGLLVLTGGSAPVLEGVVLRASVGAAAGGLAGFRVEHRPQLVLEGLALDPPCFRMAGSTAGSARG